MKNDFFFSYGRCEEIIKNDFLTSNSSGVAYHLVGLINNMVKVER